MEKYEAHPYKLEPPAVVSFSGGRTSAFMLFNVLRAFGGRLPADVHAAFANTGKERLETLDFVRECEASWNVKVHWLEYGRGEVDYHSASRKGEPFAALIEKKRFLPNPVTRFCTQELKIRCVRDFMRRMGYEHWDIAIGLRADEPGRVAKTRKPSRERWEVVLPLADARVTVRDVNEFWANNKQGFDLQLKSYEGNCDLCFLKGTKKRLQIIRETPAVVEWWIAQEERSLGSKPGGARFRKDTPSYAELLHIVKQQPLLFDACEIDDLNDCFCHD